MFAYDSTRSFQIRSAFLGRARRTKTEERRTDKDGGGGRSSSGSRSIGGLLQRRRRSLVSLLTICFVRSLMHKGMGIADFFMRKIVENAFKGQENAFSMTRLQLRPITTSKFAFSIRATKILVSTTTSSTGLTFATRGITSKFSDNSFKYRCSSSSTCLVSAGN